MKQITRPSMECLQELELAKDQDRILSLQTHLREFLIDGARYASELKAYQKILADAERNSRSDPNNELWLSQLEEKTKRHQQCLDAIDNLVRNAVGAIDQHSRSEAVSVTRSLVQDGFFDKPLPPKNNLLPTSSSTSTAVTSNPSIAIIQKGLENERTEREDSVQSIVDRFEKYKEFNNNRFEEFQKRFDQYVQSQDTRLKDQVENHRKELTSLKAGYAQIKNSLVPNKIAHSTTSPHVTGAQTNHPIDHRQLETMVHDKVQLELTKQLDNHQTSPNRRIITKLVEDVRGQLDQLTQHTKTTLEELHPEIKRVTNSIQLQVIQSTKTVISDGHQDISSLIQEMFAKAQQRVDELQPAINRSNSQIQQLDSTQKTFQAQINQDLESKVKKLSDQIGSVESKISKKEDSKDIIGPKQIIALKNHIRDVEAKLNRCKDDLSKSMDELKPAMLNITSQLDEIKRSLESLIDRVEKIEKNVVFTQRLQRYSTPAPEPSCPTYSPHHSAQTPPSPPTSKQMSQPVMAEFTRVSPSTRYHSYNRSAEHQSVPSGNNYHPTTSANCTQSHNVSIAARFTNAPSLNNTTSGSSSFSNNQLPNKTNHNVKGKRNQSREPSLAISTNRNLSNIGHDQTQPQPMGGGRGVIGMNGGPTQNSKNFHNTHPPYSNPEFRENSSDLHANQQNRHAQQFTSVVNGNSSGNNITPLPQSTLPLAKRLKTDNKQQHYHRPVSNDNNSKNNKSNPLLDSLAINNTVHHQNQNQKKFHQQQSRRN